MFLCYHPLMSEQIPSLSFLVNKTQPKHAKVSDYIGVSVFFFFHFFLFFIVASPAFRTKKKTYFQTMHVIRLLIKRLMLVGGGVDVLKINLNFRT